MNQFVTDPRDAAGASTIEVPLHRLDPFLAGRIPKLLKVDVEGFELDVLEGAATTLAAADLLAVLVQILDDKDMVLNGRSSWNLTGC